MYMLRSVSNSVSINTARAVLILTEGPVSIDAARAVLMLTGKPVSINTDRFAWALPTFRSRNGHALAIIVSDANHGAFTGSNVYVNGFRWLQSSDGFKICTSCLELDTEVVSKTVQ